MSGATLFSTAWDIRAGGEVRVGAELVLVRCFGVVGSGPGEIECFGSGAPHHDGPVVRMSGRASWWLGDRLICPLVGGGVSRADPTGSGTPGRWSIEITFGGRSQDLCGLRPELRGAGLDDLDALFGHRGDRCCGSVDGVGQSIDDPVDVRDDRRPT